MEGEGEEHVESEKGEGCDGSGAGGKGEESGDCGGSGAGGTATSLAPGRAVQRGR